MNETGPKSASEPGIMASPGAEPRWRRFDPPLMPHGSALRDLLDHGVPGARATAIEYLDRGITHSNYRVDLAASAEGAPWSGPAVVRLRLSRSDEGPRHEGALGDLLHDRCPGLAPRLLATESSETPEPHRRSLFSWIDGEPLDEVEPGHRPGGQGTANAWAACSADLALALFRLHAIALPGFGRLDATGQPSGQESDAVRDVFRRVEERFQNPAHGLVPERVRALRDAFARMCGPHPVGDLVRPALAHGDLSPGHVLVRRDPGSDLLRLAGLIDWERARAADPASDFAALRLEWSGRLVAPARAVERSYLELSAGVAPRVDPADWERRVARALVPRLLDARMVAQRRLASATLEQIDRQLDLVLLDGAADA